MGVRRQSIPIRRACFSPRWRRAGSIEWIAAHSPQAKGRIERCFGTLQDRLVKGLRKAGAATMEEANHYLEVEFLPDWNRRFVVKAGNEVDAHRPVGATL